MPPKVDVRAAVFDDRVLLVQESMDRRWTLPGSYADVGFSAAQNVVRRSRRPGCARRGAPPLLGAAQAEQPYDGRARVLQAVLRVRASRRGRAGAGPRTLDAGFFALDALPPLSTHRVLESDIVAAFAARSDPSLPVLFD